MVSAVQAYGFDIYNHASAQLTIPAVAVGSATYSDVVITVGSILSGPTGKAPIGSHDSYDPNNNQLTVPDVLVGTSTHLFNCVGTVASLVSIGSVIGADTYDGIQLSIPSVQVLGGSVYTNVAITVGSIVSAGGGMPMNVRDVYHPANAQLSIAAVQTGSRVYTNAIVKVGKILAASGGGTGAIVVVASGPSGVLNAGATRQFSASVSGTSDAGVTWSVSEGGGTITAAGLYTAPALPGTYTVKATAHADGVSFALLAVPDVIPEGHIAGYDVGVDYHATGADFLNTAFISQYDTPSVRQTVQKQLQGMADRGATLISTRLSLVLEPGTPNTNGAWALTFPMTSREQANLHSYATDVAAIVGSGGNRLRLELCLLWLGAADYTVGSPTSGLGDTPVSAATYTARVQATTDAVLAAINGVSRPDGVAVVDIVYIDGEAMIGAPGEVQPKPNEGWFMTTHYPRFVQVVQQAGFTPSVYFNISDTQADYLTPGYVDVTYPELNGHRSMYWLYRTLHFMHDNALPLPTRIDFSMYVPNDLPLNAGVTYAQLEERGFDDADAVLPLLGIGSSYGVAETYYFPDAAQRRSFGQVFAAEASAHKRLHSVTFWSTPDGGGTGVDNAYPFAIEDYLPPPD